MVPRLGALRTVGADDHPYLEDMTNHDLLPGKPSRPSRGTRRGRSSGGPPGRATATPSAWSAAGGAWSSRCSTYRSSPARPPTGHIADRLLAVPFRQVRERGFEAHDDGTPLVVVDVETELEFSVEEVVDGDRRHRGGVRRPRRLRHRRRGVRQARRGDHPRRDRAGRGRQPRHRPALPRDRRGLGRRQGADRAQAAARARARRLLDLPLLHRRPLPGRRQPGAARLDPRRRRPDEPDQRHLPAAHRAEAPTWPASCSTSCTTRRRSTSSSWSSTRSSR